MKFLNITGLMYNYKGFINSETTLTAYVHGAFKCYTQYCNVEYLTTDLAQLNHYRDNFKQPTDNITLEDKTIWRYKDELVAAVKSTLEKTNFRP